MRIDHLLLGSQPLSLVVKRCNQAVNNLDYCIGALFAWCYKRKMTYRTFRPLRWGIVVSLLALFFAGRGGSDPVTGSFVGETSNSLTSVALAAGVFGHNSTIEGPPDVTVVREAE